MDRLADTDTPDDALLIAFANGDAASGHMLLHRLAPRLFGYATRVLGDRTEAEDVVQETMIRLWKIAPDWRQGEAQVATWAYRVTANLCTDQLRRRKTRGAVDIDSVAEPEADLKSVVEQMTEKDRADALDEALGALPDRQRQAVILRHIEGLSNPDIAEIMDIGVEAVESLTARGKRALKALLSGKKEELGYDH
ncbi:MAG: RNA polymerase sigma factor [Paracoccaceae bacterium]